ncbi:MAG: hypothetical protein ACJ8LG_15420 [Massilia sp.]
MKSSYLGASIALACALGLSACGGSSGNLLLSGNAYGVTKDTLVLQNNGAHDVVISPAAVQPIYFYFPDLIETDSDYNVTVKSIPSNAEKCEVTNGKGRSAFNVSNVVVVCTLKMHRLAGSITGLGNASGLIVVNGSDRKPIDPGATSFEMSKVGEDAAYGITILQQPANLTCSVSPNGTGRMQTADITDIAISCGPAA